MLKSWKRDHKLKNLGFVKTFTNFTRPTRIALIVMLGAGWVVFFLCRRVDLSNSTWWHRQSYMPNIWAAFTVFLIGAPVALIILDTFTGEREEKAALDRVNSLSKLAWDEYKNDVYKFCTPERMAALKDDVHAVQQIHDGMLKAVSDYTLRDGQSRFRRPDDGHPTIFGASDEEYNALMEYAQVEIAWWQGLLDRVHTVIPPSAALQIEWSAVLTSWSTLDQYIRLQRMERQLRWFDRDIDSELHEHMSAQSHPLKQFSNISDSDFTSSLHNMTTALDALRNFTELSKQEIDWKFYLSEGNPSATPNEFPWLVGTGYLYAAETGFNSLHALRTLVERIEAKNWPESESKPV